jgi:hypothetical protein
LVPVCRKALTGSQQASSADFALLAAGRQRWAVVMAGNMEHGAHTNRKYLGTTGLALAVSSFIPYLGLLFLPAALVSIVALLRKSSLVMALVGLGAAFVRFVGASVQLPAIPPTTPAFLYRPYASVILANYSLPSVPVSATRIRLSAGGLFAKNVFMALDAPESDVRDFLKRLGNGDVRQVGQGGCRLLTYAQEDEVLQRAFAEGKEVDLTGLVNVTVLDWLPWYRPDSIEVGWFASRENQNVTGFALYYDSQRRRAYFRWHYS